MYLQKKIRCACLLYCVILFGAYAQDQWQPINDGLSNLGVLALNGINDQTLFAGTANGKVFRSINSGTSWIDVTHNIDSAGITGIALSSAGEIYVASRFWVDEGRSHGLYLSTDLGETWTAFEAGLPANYAPLCLEMDSNNVPYLGISGPDAEHYLYRFSTTSLQWESVSNQISAPIVTIEIAQDDSIYLGEGIQLAGNGILFSNDGGQSVTRLDFPGFGSDVVALHVDHDDYLYAAHAGQGPYRLDSEWEAIWAGLPSESFEVAFIESRPSPFFDTYIGIRGHGVYRTVNHGEAWSAVNQGLSNLNVTQVAVGTDGSLFCATQGGGVFRSTDFVPLQLSSFGTE